MKKNIYHYGKQTIDNKDIASINKVLKSAFLTQGPVVTEFEKSLCHYTKAKYALAVANGTVALHLAMLVLGIQKDHEVITSPLTFVASANCVLYCGGKVVFADIEEDSGLIDPSEIEKKITKNTKAIIPVHYAGQSADMEKIAQIAKKHNLFVIEDAAHAIGSEYQGSKVGSCRYSDMTIFSFHPVKTITTGEGGAITTNNHNLYKKLLLLRTHGITKERQDFKNPYNIEIGPWYYEMQFLGFNYRLTDIQAALGVSQMRKISHFNKKRREIVEIYKKAFAKDERFMTLTEKTYGIPAYHLFPLLINFGKIKKTKTELFKDLEKNGLHLQVHYIPVHLQPYYKKFGYKLGDFPNAEKFYQQEVSLPLYPSLTSSDINKIIKTIKTYAV